MNDALCIFILVLLICIFWPGKKDDTDSDDRRSGLVLYTDNKTGLQYIGNPLGGITPRLDETGRHMKVEKK